MTDIIENEKLVIHEFRISMENFIKPSKYKKVTQRRIDKFISGYTQSEKDDVVQRKS